MRTLRYVICVSVLAGWLAGCVRPEPFASPPLVAPRTFDSPLLTYFPALRVELQGKKGVSLACGYDDMTRMAQEVAELGVSWIWNWQTDPPLFPGVESVPTIWDASVIGRPLGGNSRWLLGFNEPDQGDQANMTPEDGARAWRRLEATYPDRKLTSPQVVQPYAYWLERWYAEYVRLYGSPPRMDALAIHTYWGKSLSEYQRQVLYYIDLAQQWGVPEVWVTEFTLAPELDLTLRRTLNDLHAYIAWLDAQPTVTRYAPWTNRVECSSFAPDSFFDTAMFAQNGQITPLGRMYSEFAPEPAAR